ncbi:YeeE/YedE family protein [Marivibrio halodurans]|uniref:YeeE/YedE family protein n=1 Tax=Marivibrio halodurans TaxID=2039722 RepID=A0A8J7S5P3_9PROT|nr:YeeE/YedE thiosulfate transporter family protein [Marivibrio halodurans]MBP5858973.1 YeeE/YedE family protein [Marivibrio halodurans]
MTPYADWISGALGGALIGLSALALLALMGRIAGISGIAGALVEGRRDGFGWRLAFVAGLVAGPLLHAVLRGGEAVAVRLDVGWPWLILGGLLVGFGTRLGSGCTSGHGVCGLARLSPRSLAAVATFFAVALAVVLVTRRVLGPAAGFGG